MIDLSPKDIILACDVPTDEQLFDLLKKLKGERPFLKIGMEMYYRYGYELVKRLKGEGYKIFLDLKLHDIPHTVQSAMKQIASLKVDMINMHASGGIAMMKAGCDAVKQIAPDTLVIAVTQLTSTSEDVLHNELLIPSSMPDTVRHYALNAKKAGLDGVVCSALEASIIKNMGLVSVTPGIRFAGGSVDDQKRVVTPLAARNNGSTYIVIGRAVTGACDVLDAYKFAKNQFVYGKN